MKAVLESRHWPAPRFRYSPLVQAGPFLKTAGMIALDPATGALQAGGAAAEAKRILGTLFAVMDEFALTVGDLVSATLYVVDFAGFTAINAVWETFFTGDPPPPARTSVGVTALPLGAGVEMEFLFYAPALRASTDLSGARGQLEGRA